MDVYTDAGGSQKFDIRGDGLVRPHAGLHVTAGGMTVQAGGATVSDGGLHVHHAGAAATVVHAEADSTSYTGDLLQLVSDTAAGTGYKFLEVCPCPPSRPLACT